MSQIYPSGQDNERYPYSVVEQHLGTSASLESKLTVRLLIDDLLGNLEDGTLELDKFGSDRFECVIDGREISVGTDENIKGDGRDYCISIGEIFIGEENQTDPSAKKAYDVNFDKQYQLRPFGDFTMTAKAEFLFDGKMSSEDIVTVLEAEKKLNEETTAATAGHYLVTEGEAQNLIRLLAEIIEAQQS